MAPKPRDHRIRRKVLNALDVMAEPASPRELSDSIDENLSSVAYHVHVLVAGGYLHLVTTEQVRGATAHFYARTELAKEAAKDG